MNSAVMAAVGCKLLSQILSIAGTHPMVVFGCMDRSKLSAIKKEGGAIPVYLYETG